MDFFQSQDAARKRTGWLVVLFALAVLGIIAAVYLTVALVLVWTQRYQSPPGAGNALSIWNPQLLLWVGGGVIVVVGAASLYKIASLSSGGQAVAQLLGGRLIDHHRADANEKKLLNVVEEMAIASGTPVPPVYIIDESGINAFAAGYAPEDAVIGVTRGAVDTLSRDELQGVVAHEFSHILNGDMRLNIRLIGVVYGIVVIGIIGYFIFRTALYSGAGRRRSRNDKSNPLPLIAIGLALIVIGYVGTFFGNLIKAAVSRQREYMADASAVQFTRNPDGIAGALKKIGGWSSGSRLDAAGAREVSHMLFGPGLHFMTSVFSTHPPLIERIRRIDPSFDGTFPEVRALKGDGEPAARSLTPGDWGLASRGTPIPPGQLAAAGLATMADRLAAVRRGQLQSMSAARAAVAQIGNPTPAHVDYAQALIASMPASLREAAREPFGARAVVFGLLMDDQAEARRRQLEALERSGDQPALAETVRLLPHVAELDVAGRLPLIDLAAPALREMSQPQYERFMRTVDELMRADDRLALFEWALQRILRRHLGSQFGHARPTAVRYRSLEPVVREVSLLLSMLAYAGQRDVAGAQQMFDMAAQTLAQPGLALCEQKACSLGALDEAIETLNGLAPEPMRKLMEACATCIAGDARITQREAELFRAIADALGCPVPPLLPGTPLAEDEGESL